MVIYVAARRIWAHALGGLETNFQSLAGELVRQGHILHVVTTAYPSGRIVWIMDPFWFFAGIIMVLHQLRVNVESPTPPLADGVRGDLGAALGACLAVDERDGGTS